MTDADGSVIIEVDANDQKAQKKLENLAKKAQKVVDGIDEKKEINVALNVSDAERELKRLEKSITSTEERMQIKQVGLQGLQDAKRAIEAQRQEAISKGQDELVIALEKEWDAINKKVEAYQQQIDAAAAKIEVQKEKYGELAQEIVRVADAEKQRTPDVSTRFSEIFSSIKSALTTAGRGALETFKEALKSIPSKAVSVVKTAFTGVRKAVTAATKGIIGFVKNMNVLEKLSDAFKSKMKRLGNILKSALVFSVIYKGLTMLKEQVASYLRTNDEFSAALGRIKGALLTAFQPIYDIILPALVSLMNALANVIATVTQFTASLFGTTAKQAQANAKSLNKEAKALEATGSAAEEAAGSLAGFDEINTIQTENKGDGGSGSTEIVPNFDYEYAETAFKSWGEAFDAFLNHILNFGIPNLKKAFSSFAAWLNSFSTRLYEMFTFPGVRQKVIQLGRDLAIALTNLVNSIDWYRLGQALGAGMNLALMFMIEFVYNFDWVNLGESLADGLNGIVSEIDWYAVGQFLWMGYKIALETLAGFISNLDMPELAKAASDMAIGFFNSITETIKNIDWKKIGQQVKEFLTNINWAEVAEACFESIGAAFGAATEFLWGLIEDAWKSVVDWWHDTAFEDGKFTFQGLLDGIVEVAKNIYHWIKEHIVDPFVNGFKDLMGIHSPSTVMADLGGYIMDGLLNGLGGKVQEVKDLFSGLWNDIKSWWNRNVSKYFTLDYWKGLGKDMIDGLLDGLNGIFSGISTWASNVWSKITGAFSKKNAVASVENSTSAGSARMAIPNMPSIAPQSIPRLATGGVIPPNREFMAVLGDQHRGYNIEAPEDLIRKIVREEAGGGNDEVVALLQELIAVTRAGRVMQVDRKVLARTAVDGINDLTTQAGKPVLLF
jgi:hypothetical protein